MSDQVWDSNNADVFDDLFLWIYDALLEKSASAECQKLLIVHFGRLGRFFFVSFIWGFC